MWCFKTYMLCVMSKLDQVKHIYLYLQSFIVPLFEILSFSFWNIQYIVIIYRPSLAGRRVSSKNVFEGLT